MAKTGKPRGRPRKNPLPVLSSVTIPAAVPETPVISDVVVQQDSAEPIYPADWRVGMLLNVRNTGADYTITLYPEEFDYRKPERALHFTNPGECQNFVSRWYMRESHDPRAR